MQTQKFEYKSDLFLIVIIFLMMSGLLGYFGYSVSSWDFARVIDVSPIWILLILGSLAIMLIGGPIFILLAIIYRLKTGVKYLVIQGDYLTIPEGFLGKEQKVYMPDVKRIKIIRGRVPFAMLYLKDTKVAINYSFCEDYDNVIEIVKERAGL